jgi:hypothetical protein
MAKTYNTISTFTSGQVLTAAQMNQIGTNVNNYRVPPMCSVYRSSNLTSYTSNTEITWNAEHWDTDAMWTSGTDITVNTAGIYVVSFMGRITGSATILFATPQIVLNNNAAAASVVELNTLTSEVRWEISTMLDCTISDTISAQVFISGGSNYVVTGAAGQSLESTRLQVAWLGQVS